MLVAESPASAATNNADIQFVFDLVLRRPETSATFFCSDRCVLSSCFERRPIRLRPPSAG